MSVTRRFVIRQPCCVFLIGRTPPIISEMTWLGIVPGGSARKNDPVLVDRLLSSIGSQSRHTKN